MSKDYYKILGVDKNASAEDLKRAFHKMAHQHHPDKAGGDAEKFKEINEAYQVLGNPQKRQQYDQFGSTFNQGGPGGFGGFQNNGFNINMDDLGDIFSNFGMGDIFGFGRKSSTGSSNRGRDLEMVLTLDFSEAVFGADKAIKLTKAVKCQTCNGSGAEPGAKIETCPVCHGTGRVNKVQRTILGAMQVQATCERCEGQGRIPSQTCRTCQGSGRVEETTELKVKIPAGIDHGETIRLSGQGEAGQRQAGSGDLYLHIKVKSDARFVRQGYNILTQAKISLSQAVLGDKIAVETVDGPVDLKIPAGTASHKTFVLKGKGVPKLQSRGRGDHLVEVRLVVPNSLSRQQKKLLEDLREAGL